MGGLLGDFTALMRSAGLSRGLPRLCFSVRRYSDEFIRKFEEIVTPIIYDTIDCPLARNHIHDSLLAISTKISFIIVGYAKMAHDSFRTDLSVLGGVLTRLYDDLLDEIGQPHTAQRLGRLFGGDEFEPEDDTEELFIRLYQEADRRIGRSQEDAFHLSVNNLHKYQVMSEQQKNPAISDEVLSEITLGKGGHALAVLLCMMCPEIDSVEHRLILKLGGVLQLLDDYQDYELDRLAGVCTRATRDDLDLSDIITQLRVVCGSLVDSHGRRQAQEFLAIVYSHLWISFFRRRLLRIGTRSPGKSMPHSRRKTSAISVLFTPGDNLVQKANQRRRRGALGGTTEMQPPYRRRPVKPPEMPQ